MAQLWIRHIRENAAQSVLNYKEGQMDLTHLKQTSNISSSCIGTVTYHGDQDQVLLVCLSHIPSHG